MLKMVIYQKIFRCKHKQPMVCLKNDYIQYQRLHLSCSSIPMDESQFFQKGEDLNHIGNLLISGPYRGRLIGYLCILSIIFSHRPHCKTESELYELEKEISYMIITLYTYHYSYLSSFNLILFLFWDFRSRNQLKFIILLVKLGTFYGTITNSQNKHEMCSCRSYI